MHSILRAGILLGALLSACGGKVRITTIVRADASEPPLAQIPTVDAALPSADVALPKEDAAAVPIDVAGETAHTGPLPALHVEGSTLRDPAGNVVILRGVDFIDLKELDTNRSPMDIRGLIDLVSDASQGWYPHVLRLTVSPDAWNADPSGYLASYLKPAVDCATDKRLYAIVDWHYVTDSAPQDPDTRAFWKVVAPTFASYTNVLFEVFNEPVDTSDPSWQTWKATAQPWVDLIRAVAPDNIVLIGGPQWSQLIGGAATDPFRGTNLVYVGHIYPQISRDVWSDTGDITIAAASRPVMITEWGYRRGASSPTSGTQRSFGDPFKTYAEANALSWSAWVADIYWQPEIFDTSWNVRTGTNDMGGFVKDWLAASKDDRVPAGL